jgi:hypothetical protein
MYGIPSVISQKIDIKPAQNINNRFNCIYCIIVTLKNTYLIKYIVIAYK